MRPQGSGRSETSWRMAVETVRERCTQGITVAEEDLASKGKFHTEYQNLSSQVIA